jgi:hypothetical protein
MACLAFSNTRPGWAVTRVALLLWVVPRLWASAQLGLSARPAACAMALAAPALGLPVHAGGCGPDSIAGLCLLGKYVAMGQDGGH